MHLDLLNDISLFGDQCYWCGGISLSKLRKAVEPLNDVLGIPNYVVAKNPDIASRLLVLHLQ